MSSFLEVFSKVRKKDSKLILRTNIGGIRYDEIISKCQSFTQIFKKHGLKRGGGNFIKKSSRSQLYSFSSICF